MNDCFPIFIKSFSLEQFSRIFTGIYQCLNLIHYALTVFRISYTKPFAGSIRTSAVLVPSLINLSTINGIKNSLFKVSMFFGSLRKVLKNSFCKQSNRGWSPQKFILTGVVSGVAVHSPLSSIYFTSPSDVGSSYVPLLQKSTTFVHLYYRYHEIPYRSRSTYFHTETTIE